jgi:hypothetical protein
MRPLTGVLKDGEWDGQRAFVVGSGPSMKGFDYSLLDGERWIACNEEYKQGKPSVALVQDVRLFAQGGPGLTPLRDRADWTRGAHLPVYFKGHPDREEQTAPDSVFQVKSAHSHLEPFRWGKSLEEGLYYGANVGMAAINLADILGANPIYLLGFDARVDDERAHHHRDYPDGWSLADSESRAHVYRLWHAKFREIAQMVRARVINLNPESGIDAFEKVPWVDIRGSICEDRR